MTTNPYSSLLSKRVQNLAPSGIRAFFELVIGMKDIISLGVGEPDFDSPWAARESAIFAIEHGHTTYTSNKGLLELRKMVSQYLSKRYRLDYDPENEILITVGVSEAMDLAIRAILNPGDRVIIPEPCFVSYHPMVYLSGGEPLYLSTRPENQFKMSPGELEKFKDSSAKAIILNYPSNPTGASYSESELKAIAKTIRRLGLFVISDEIYGELTYEGQHTAFPSLPGMKERTLYLNGFSKAFAMTGWRIGYAAGPKDVIEAINKIHQYTIMCAPIMSQWAACEVLRNPEALISQMKKEYERRRNYVVGALKDIGLDCIHPSGAFYAFASIRRTNLDSVTFAKKLLETEKVAVVPGVAFGPSGEGFVRISYATSLEQLKEALERIKRFLSHSPL